MVSGQLKLILLAAFEMCLLEYLYSLEYLSAASWLFNNDLYVGSEVYKVIPILKSAQLLK